MKLPVRALALLLTLIFCAVVSVSCFERKNQFSIEIITAGTETEFWSSAYSGAQAAAEVYNASVKLFGPALEEDYSRQENALRQSIERKPDAIIIGAADSNMAAELANLAADNGIQIVAAASPIGGDKRVTYVGSDNYELGQTLSREIKSRFLGGAVAVISFTKESLAAEERELGFLEEMAGDPAFRTLETLYCGSDAEKAKQLALKLLADNDDLTAIACLNAQSTIGASRAIEQSGYQGIFLGGIDCSVEEAELIERGVIGVTLLQNPYAIGYFGVETAVKKLRGESPDKNIYTKFHIITRENMFKEEYQRLIFPLP